MLQTYANLPKPISEAITALLATQNMPEVIAHAQKLHERYITQEKEGKTTYISDEADIFAYLALRTPATYAQIYAAFTQIQEVLPQWHPTTMLDIGSGPGVGIWAAKTCWPMLETATCLDQERGFLSLGKQISSTAQLSVNISWQQGNASYVIEHDKTQYDIVLLANVLNELDVQRRDDLISSAYNHCKGIMVIVESGTPQGSSIVEHAAKSFSHKQLLAPYINNTFIKSEKYWLHFPQRFIRPEFQRRVRQKMRESELMASDFEQAKYSYVALGEHVVPEKIWGRCIGTPQSYKGYLQVPVLTDKGIESIKVMKRNKKQYRIAKKLRWGEGIQNKNDLVLEKSSLR